MDIFNRISWLKQYEVNKEINKESVLRNTLLENDDKIILKKYCEKIYLRYKIFFNKYQNTDDLYNEIHIIEVNINNYKAIYDINYILSKVILYPVILIVKQNNKYKVVISQTRINQKNYNKNVINAPIFSSCMFENYSTYIEEKMFLDLNKIDFENIKNILELHNIFYKIINCYRNRFVFVGRFLKDIRKLYYGIKNNTAIKNEVYKLCTIYRFNRESDLNTYNNNKLDKYNDCEEKGKFKKADSEEIFYCIYNNFDYIFKKNRIENIDELYNRLYGHKFYKDEDTLKNNCFEEYEEKNTVEYSNIVELQNSVNKYDTKTFIIKKIDDKFLPKIPELLLGKSIGDTINYNKKNYKIIKIFKDKNGDIND